MGATGGQWAEWTFPFTPGNLTAVGYSLAGAITARHTVETTSAAVALVISVDVPSLATGTGEALVLDGQDTGANTPIFGSTFLVLWTVNVCRHDRLGTRKRETEQKAVVLRSASRHSGRQQGPHRTVRCPTPHYDATQHTSHSHMADLSCTSLHLT